MRASVQIIIFLCLVGYACVEPYNPKNVSYDNVLVVEGSISNEEKPQLVKLSHTSQLNEQVFIPEPGADVKVEISPGKTIKFSEVKPGLYQSQSFAGIIGNAYTLSVKTSNGREYKSSQVMMKASPPIGRIYAEFITSPERGIRISLDTEDPLNNTHYYRWNYVETYEIQVPFPSNYVILPAATEPTWRYDRVDQCWANDTLRSVYIKSTRTQDQDKVIAYPLRFIPENSYIFRIKYSMLVQQFALSEEAYKYWDKIRIFNETQGSLADIQPGIVSSNVLSITDPSETVLGYFDASGISEKRVFFDYRDFKEEGYVRPSFESYCGATNPTLVRQNNILEYMMTHKGVTIWDVIGMTPDAQFELLPTACCDCSEMGATVKPSFWP
jgi:hypothetical protein